VTTHEFVEYALDQLAPIGVIHTSKMFGGVLLKVNNKQLGVIMMDTLYFKVKEPELQKKFHSMDSEQFEYSKKDSEEPIVVKNWWSVPEEALEDKKVLIGLAHEVLLQGS
jgi:DNA transformation protein